MDANPILVQTAARAAEAALQEAGGFGFPILSLTIFLPLVGAGLILLLDGSDEAVARNARYAALWTSLLTLAVSLPLWLAFDGTDPGFQFVEQVEWLPALGIAYKVGLDGISMPFVLLSTVLVPICILASWDSVKLRVREYMVAFLVLETLMVGMFASLDMFLFYVFFEGVLIPMFLIIGVWGGPRRVYAAFKFFLYTLAGSVLMLVAVLAVYLHGVDGVPTADLPTLLERFTIDPAVQTWLFLAFLVAFAVKVPMWPVHTWLPDAHVEAPTAGSVILAGVLLKMGGYGFLRFSIPLLPDATEFFTPLMFALSVIAIVYTSMVALVQEDMKKLIAYSSVAHMGFVTLGLFALGRDATGAIAPQGVEGAIFQMLSHGVVSAALFLCVGVVYDRLHTREIARYGGLVRLMPRYALAFMIFLLASVGLPGTSGFVGEFLALAGAWQTNELVAALAALGMVLGAAYMLVLYRRVVFGGVADYHGHAMPDLHWREIVAFVPLVILVFWMGIAPSGVLDQIHAAVGQLLEQHAAALATSPTAGSAQP